MQIPIEVGKWLRENVYLVKGKDYYFFSDFPDNEIPDRLECPINKNLWLALSGREKRNG